MCAANILWNPTASRTPSAGARVRRFAASVAVAGVAGVGVGLTGAAAFATAGQDVSIQAQGTATDTGTDITLDSQVVDQAGVLSDSEESSIASTLADGVS